MLSTAAAISIICVSTIIILFAIYRSTKKAPVEYVTKEVMQQNQSLIRKNQDLRAQFDALLLDMNQLKATHVGDLRFLRGKYKENKTKLQAIYDNDSGDR